MRKLLGSLRFRAPATQALLIVAAFAALGLYLLPKIENDFRQNIEADLESQATMVENVSQPLFETGASETEFDALTKELGANTGTRVTIIAVDGRVLGDSEIDPSVTENHLQRPEIQEASRAGRGSDERTSATVGEAFTYVALRLGTSESPLGYVRVARPSASVDASLSHITRAVLIAVTITAVAAAGVSLLISETALRPLGRLAEAVRSLASGRFDERIRPRPSGEVGDLADAFNQMGEDLQKLMNTSSQEHNRVMAVLNSSNDAMMALNPRGEITFANIAAEHLFGRRQDELIGNPVAWVMPHQSVVEAVQAAQSDGRREAVTIERPNHVLRVVAAPIIGGGEWSSLIVIHDLTDIRRVVQMRRDFIANVSHELRTPLAGIKSVIETLQGGALSDAAVARDFLARADHEVDRLVEMVEELLELSRVESGQVPLAQEPVDVSIILDRAVDRLRGQAQRKRQALLVDVAPKLPEITGDAGRLERAIVSLLHNAIKFTPEGGEIRVIGRFTEGALTVSVSDNGEGIDPTDLPRVFERFYKADRARRAEGTGLGLAIVKHTAEAHGGNVKASSELGKGSTFSISIPVRPAAEHQAVSQ